MLWETGSSVPGLLSHTYFWETKRNGSLQDTILLGEHKRRNYVAQDWNWHERPNILDPLLNSSWKQRNLQFSYWDWVLSIRKLTPGSCMHRWRNTNGEHLVAGGRNKKTQQKKTKTGKHIKAAQGTAGVMSFSEVGRWCFSTLESRSQVVYCSRFWITSNTLER